MAIDHRLLLGGEVPKLDPFNALLSGQASREQFDQGDERRTKSSQGVRQNQNILDEVEAKKQREQAILTNRHVQQLMTIKDPNQRALAHHTFESKMAKAFPDLVDDGQPDDLSDEALQAIFSGTSAFIDRSTNAGSSSERQRAEDFKIIDAALDENGNLPPIDKMSARLKAAAVAQKIIPAPIGSAEQTITSQGNVGSVADVREELSEAGARGATTGKLETEEKIAPNIEKQKVFAKDAAALTTEIYKRVGGIEQNIANMRQGVQAIDEGAATGPIVKWLPSLRESSIRLDNIKNTLGLDVISSVTFGALSAKELETAFDTAQPNLKGPALKQWFIDRIDSQEKLLGALNESADFLAEKDATIPGLMKARRGGQLGAGKGAGPSLQGQDLDAYNWASDPSAPNWDKDKAQAIFNKLGVK